MHPRITRALRRDDVRGVGRASRATRDECLPVCAQPRAVALVVGDRRNERDGVSPGTGGPHEDMGSKLWNVQITVRAGRVDLERAPIVAHVHRSPEEVFDRRLWSVQRGHQAPDVLEPAEDIHSASIAHGPDSLARGADREDRAVGAQRLRTKAKPPVVAEGLLGLIHTRLEVGLLLPAVAATAKDIDGAGARRAVVRLIAVDATPHCSIPGRRRWRAYSHPH